MDNNDIKKINVTTSSTNVKTAPDDGDPFADVKKELATRFTLLPEDLQQIIIGSDYQAKLFEIAKTHKMTYEQLGSIEMETTMVLLGMTKPDDFRDELQMELKTNDKDVDPLVADIKKQIFAPIHETLKKVYDAKREPEDYLKDADGAPPAPAVAIAIAKAPEVKTSTPSAVPSWTQSNIPQAVGVKQNVPAPMMSAPSGISPIMKSSLTANEKTVLTNSGVVITDSNPPGTRSPMTISQADFKAPTPRVSFPTSTTPLNIVGDKMTGAQTIPAKKETDYSISKPTPAVSPASSSTDPYRETI